MIDFDSSKLEQRLGLIAHEHNYQLISHVVELRGLCEDCQEAKEPTALEAISEKIRSVGRRTQQDQIEPAAD